VFVNVCTSLLEEKNNLDKNNDGKKASATNPNQSVMNPMIGQHSLMAVLRLHAQQLGCDERALLALLKSYEFIYLDR
jgi:hypothetical protein